MSHHLCIKDKGFELSAQRSRCYSRCETTRIKLVVLRPVCSLCKMWTHTAKAQLRGSGRVISGSRIWLISWQDPGYDCSLGTGTRQNLSIGWGIFFACLLGIREIVITQTKVLAAKAIECAWLVIYCHRTCQRVFCFNQMPEKSMWYNSIPVIDSMLNWLICSISKVHIHCNLERFFSQLIR